MAVPQRRQRCSNSHAEVLAEKGQDVGPEVLWRRAPSLTTRAPGPGVGPDLRDGEAGPWSGLPHHPQAEASSAAQEPWRHLEDAGDQVDCILTDEPRSPPLGEIKQWANVSGTILGCGRICVCLKIFPSNLPKIILKVILDHLEDDFRKVLKSSSLKIPFCQESRGEGDSKSSFHPSATQRALESSRSLPIRASWPGKRGGTCQTII